MMTGGKFFGVCPYASGNDYNDPLAPWNDTDEWEETDEREECPQCHGEGVIYFDEEGEPIAKEMYERNPYDFDCDICRLCNGEGKIID